MKASEPCNSQAISSSRSFDESFYWPIRVYIEDTDAGGIVYYINYLKYIERARTEFLRSLGFGKQFIFNAELMFVVHSVNSRYLKPARLDDELLVSAELRNLGKSSMLLVQKVYRAGRVVGSGAAETLHIEPSAVEQSLKVGELLFQADVKLACVDRVSVKPKRIPVELASVLQQSLFEASV